MHDIKNGIKNLTAVITLFKNQYKFEDKDKELLDYSFLNLNNIIKSFDNLANSQTKQYFVLGEIWHILEKIYISQFKIEHIHFDIVYEEIDQQLQVNIPTHTAYQLFSNLVMNAVEALKTTEIKLLKVKIRHISDDQIEISIIDSGCGISDELKEKIFDIGFSTNQSSGVGLPYIKSVLDIYGGSVFVENKLELPYKTAFIVQILINPIIQ